jgi:hypothetical protein
VDEGIRSVERVSKLTAAATIASSREFVAAAGERLRIQVYPRPLETNEVEVLWVPQGDPAPDIDGLRDVADVLSGGSLANVILDGDEGTARKGKLFYARAASATADVELRVSVTHVALPATGRSCQSSGVERR